MPFFRTEELKDINKIAKKLYEYANAVFHQKGDKSLRELAGIKSHLIIAEEKLKSKYSSEQVILQNEYDHNCKKIKLSLMQEYYAIRSKFITSLKSQIEEEQKKYTESLKKEWGHDQTQFADKLRKKQEADNKHYANSLKTYIEIDEQCLQKKLKQALTLLKEKLQNDEKDLESIMKTELKNKSVELRNSGFWGGIRSVTGYFKTTDTELALELRKQIMAGADLLMMEITRYKYGESRYTHFSEEPVTDNKEKNELLLKAIMRQLECIYKIEEARIEEEKHKKASQVHTSDFCRDMIAAHNELKQAHPNVYEFRHAIKQRENSHFPFL